MNERDETLDDLDDGLLRALARTPEVAPFSGTDRYRVISCLGEGGFGVVYEVEDTGLGRRLALKTLKPQAAGYAANIRRLKREFRSVADLVHPNLVGLHELSSTDGRWFFTMDLIRGSDFLEHVRGRPDQEPGPRDATGVLSEPRLRAALRQLVRGVSALHREGIIHRDLKPPNVLVETGGRVVILDFGLAGEDLPGDLDFGGLPGTPAFMAPEQRAGRAATAAADWYSVGVMLYQALAGRLPEGADPPAPSRFARVPGDLERLCLALLRGDPGERPDAGAIEEALGEPGSPANVSTRVASPVFVGRDRELAALRAAFDAVAEGQPAVVRVHGAPGIGKSALLERFTGELERSAHVACLAGRCHERESVPFKAIDGIIDALVGYLRALPRHEASALLPRDIHLVTQLFPALEAVAATRDVPRRLAPRSPRQGRVRAFAALKELVGRVADKQPLVIAIDDLQWGDVDSARLLSQLIAPPDRPPMLLVLAHRDGEESGGDGLRETRRALEIAGARVVDLPLDPLVGADAVRLAGALLAEGRESLASELAARGDGHPLFMAELARTLTPEPAASAPLPTLMDIIWQRALRLSAGARALLETVAVAGQPLPSPLCLEAAGVGAAGVDALRALRAEKLVATGGGGAIDVFHDRVRDAVLWRADASTRRLRHLALARTLERAPEPDLEALARHFHAGGEGATAGRYAARAGDAAMRSMAFDRAAELYRLAIAQDPRSAALHERMGDALYSAGSDADAGMAYREAARLSSGSQTAALLRRATEHLLQVGELDAGFATLASMLDAVGEKEPATPRRAVFEIVYHMTRLRLRGFRARERAEGEVPEDELDRLDALDTAARGLGYHKNNEPLALGLRFCRAALAAGEPRRAALGRVWAAIALMGSGVERTATVDELLDSAEDTAERLDNPDLRAWALRWRAEYYHMFGDTLGARELFGETAEWIAERCVGNGTLHRFCRVATAFLDIRLGALERSRRVAEPVFLDALERSDPVALRGVTTAVMAPLALAAGDLNEAARALQWAVGESRCAMTVYEADAIAAVAMYRGDPDSAVEAWRQRWPLIKAEGMLIPSGLRLIGVRSIATALLARGGEGDAREAAKHLRTLRRYRFAQAAAVRAAIGANLALRRGRADRARALLEEAAAGYDAAKLPLDAAACRHRLGQLSGDARLTDAAAAELVGCGVADPDRWVAVLFPPITDRSTP